MATSLQNKLSDLEARLKAENADKMRDRLGKDMQELNLDSIGASQTPTPPPRNQRPILGFSLSQPPPTRRTPTTPTNLMTGFSLCRPGSNNCLSSLSGPQGGLNLSRPGSGSSTSSTSGQPGFSLSRPGSTSSLSSTGSISPADDFTSIRRRRQEFQLPCSPQAPKPPDSAEIEMKYQEIMKQSGILTLGEQRIATDISDLTPLGELGHGTCGHVIKMRHKRTQHLMAVKQMRRSGNREENKRIIMDLDVVLKSHSCPYIVQCIGTFITSSDVWICMELMGSCLEKILKRTKKPTPEKILGKVAVATVQALHYLKEEHGVIHRDIKPSNILVNERGDIKLCDFGISGRLVDSKAKTRSAGCAAYMAPERIDPPDPTKPDYDIRADVWSLGISLVELATGVFPYTNCKTDFEVLTKVLEQDPPRLPAGRGFSMDFGQFVCQCLTKDFRKRPKYKRLLELNFIKRYTVTYVDVARWFTDSVRIIAMATPTPSPSPVSPINLG